MPVRDQHKEGLESILKGPQREEILASLTDKQRVAIEAVLGAPLPPKAEPAKQDAKVTPAEESPKEAPKQHAEPVKQDAKPASTEEPPKKAPEPQAEPAKLDAKLTPVDLCLDQLFAINPGAVESLKASPEKLAELADKKTVTITTADGSRAQFIFGYESERDSDTYSRKTFCVISTLRLSLSSPSFANGAKIHDKFSCYGDGISPALEWKNLPEGAGALVLTCDDHSTTPVLRHWAISIKSNTTSLNEGISNTTGISSIEQLKYTPLCPHDGATHHYKYTLYALKLDESETDTLVDGKLPLRGYDQTRLDEFLSNHTLEKAELVGTYNGAHATEGGGEL